MTDRKGKHETVVERESTQAQCSLSNEEIKKFIEKNPK